jgi:hypothetical protein
MLSLSTLVTTPARALEPAVGSGIVVDGNPGEWNLATDFFADMYNEGRPDPSWSGYAVLSKLYLRYDCEQQILSALVLDVEDDGEMVDASASEAWIKLVGMNLAGDLLIDGNGNGDSNPRSFAWVHSMPSDPNSPVIGYESRAQLSLGSYSSFEARLNIAGAVSSTGFHGFDDVAFDEQLGELNQPGTTKIRVTYPYEGGPALFPTTEIDYDGNGVADFTTTSWCIDTDHTIYNNTWYCTTLVSSYDYPHGLDDTRWANLDVVNWILNQGFVGQSSGPAGTYTYGDVQIAIWSLLEDATSPNGLGPYSMTRVTQILASASAAVGLENPLITYEPPCDGVVGVILVPTNCGGSYSQFLVAQMLVSEYPGFCAAYDLALELECVPETAGAVDEPTGFQLAPAHPNPFNPTTTLTVTLTETGTASLKVFDMAGHEVVTLFNGLMAAGTQDVLFRAENLPSGVYFAVLQSAQGTATQKLVLIK